MNINSEEKNCRQSGENFTQEEKDLFLEIMRESAKIIENKQTDTNTNKKKNMEWHKICNKLKELTGKKRDIAQLKGFWRRTKLLAKKNVLEHKRVISTIGGGERPPSPSPDDLKVKELCPTDFVIERNQFDSDGFYQNNDKLNETGADHEALNGIVYDVEINEDAQTETDAPFVNEVITVADVYNNEVHIEQNRELQVETPKSKVLKYGTPKLRKTETSHKGNITASNIELKKRMRECLEEEHVLKLKYQKGELAYQELRHKLEIDILLLEKEKKELEIKILRKSL